jgi:hypothetical protein
VYVKSGHQQCPPSAWPDPKRLFKCLCRRARLLRLPALFRASSKSIADRPLFPSHSSVDLPGQLEQRFRLTSFARPQRLLFEDKLATSLWRSQVANPVRDGKIKISAAVQSQKTCLGFRRGIKIGPDGLPMRTDTVTPLIMRALARPLRNRC